MNKKYKFEIIRVNLSTPFLNRGRCKSCGTHGKIYYYSINPVLWMSATKIKDNFDVVSKYFKWTGTDQFFIDDFRWASIANHFAYTPISKSFNPKLHRCRGVNPAFDTVEYITCDCGSTIWAFNEKAAKARPEISNRKSRRNSPQKFIF